MNRQRGTDGNRRAFQKGKLRPFHGLIPSVPIPSVPLRKNNAGTDGKGHKLSPSPVLGFVGSGTTGNRREPTGTDGTGNRVQFLFWCMPLAGAGQPQHQSNARNNAGTGQANNCASSGPGWARSKRIVPQSVFLLRDNRASYPLPVLALLPSFPAGIAARWRVRAAPLAGVRLASRHHWNAVWRLHCPPDSTLSHCMREHI